MPRPKKSVTVTDEDRVREVVAMVGKGRDIEQMAAWVVARYAKTGDSVRQENSDEWAMANIPLSDGARKKVEDCHDEFIEVFDAYMMLYETMEYKTLVANLIAERHILRQLMRTPPSSEEGGTDVDWDKVQKGFKTTCDLSKESVEMRRRNSAMQAALYATGSISEAALKRKSSSKAIGAESLANGSGKDR